MDDLIRAGALLTNSEDEMGEGFDETGDSADVKNPDGDNDDDENDDMGAGMGSWEEN